MWPEVPLPAPSGTNAENPDDMARCTSEKTPNVMLEYRHARPEFTWAR